MSATAIVQARMGSSRLPGKVVLPLDGTPAIQHEVRRAQTAERVDQVVVATTFHRRDDLVERYARGAGAAIYRGSEDDVMGRIANAAAEFDAEVILRLTGDNPFVAPPLMNKVIERVSDRGADYASNKIERTFPIGIDAEAFTADTLEELERETTDPYDREHVTPRYYDRENDYDVANITVEDVYGSPVFDAGPELRMTLDEPADYRLFQRVYNAVEYDDTIDERAAVEYILENDLDAINEEIDQKTL